MYRGDRLLLSGDWLGLLRKEESYKLVRIQINLPNSVDSDWQIDIKNQKHTHLLGAVNNWKHMQRKPAE